MTFGLALVAGINLFGFIPQTGTALYNYALGLLPVGALLLMFYLSCLGLGLIHFRLPKP